VRFLQPFARDSPSIFDRFTVVCGLTIGGWGAAPAWAWLADTKGIRPAAQLASALFLTATLLNLFLLCEFANNLP
jgi:hypothetical protein